MAKNAVEDSLTVFLNIQFLDLVNQGIIDVLDPGNAVSGGRRVVEGEDGGRGGSDGNGSGSGIASGDLERRIAELERRVEELERQLGGDEAGATASGTSSPGGERTGGGRPERTRGGPERGPVDSKVYELVPALDLRGRLGRLVISYPEGTTDLKASAEIFVAGAEKAIRIDYGPLAAELTPGTYDIEIGGRRLAGVPIESRKDTRLRVDVLRLVATGNTNFQIFEPGGKKAIQVLYGTSEIGLPAGPVEIEVSGQREKVTIRAGEIVEY